MTNFSKVLVFVFAVAASLMASENASPRVKLLTERHRTEWNWVNYRFYLTNNSNETLVNPSIRYFAENPRIQYCNANSNKIECSEALFGNYGIDSSLAVAVDYFSAVRNVSTELDYGSKYTTVSFNLAGEIPAKSEMEIHLRIMKKDWSAWDCSYDYSYQAIASVREKNYKIAVYDAKGNILWGNDPVAVKHESSNVYWYDRAGTMVISQYDGADSSKIINGRFWMLKGSSLSAKEKNSLDSVGVQFLETTRYQNKGLHLLKAKAPINKKLLNKIVPDFYNAYGADDTTRLYLKYTPDDFYEKTKTCASDGSCTEVVRGRDNYDLVIECWPDISMNLCKNVVAKCGGINSSIDRSVVLSNMPKDSVQCLEKHRDVRLIRFYREGIPENDVTRNTINLSPLQSDLDWQNALTTTDVTSDWLSGVDYTGEGIYVGVYDGGVDFSHPGLNEVDVNGNDIPRKAPADANWSLYERTGVNDHATHVAGIIGGNGRMSQSYSPSVGLYHYRGIAPKVKFFSGSFDYYHQRGHVVNHSHLLSEGLYANGKNWFYYGDENRSLDNNIFFDWKAPSEGGDLRTKTIVLSAGNGGESSSQSLGIGYYSLTKESKNAIVVGNSYGLDRWYSSSMGPTWDGRIKPDLMAPGTGVVSSWPVSTNPLYYGEKTGTSMASPVVAGIAALMYQKFQKKTGVPLDVRSIRNSTVKSLLIHSAIDMVGHTPENDNPDLIKAEKGGRRDTPYTKGPDFATGWGYVNAQAALGLMDDYDVNHKEFAKFREVKVYNDEYKRWVINVPSGQKSLRTTLVWDDAPADSKVENYMESKLVNDLDVYLVSPSGKIFYPWKLDPLPKDNMKDDGSLALGNELTDRKWGLEKITYDDAAKEAYKCAESTSIQPPSEDCFDRLNNVEVVDVENPESGIWQVVVHGYNVEFGNNASGNAQIASVVSDFELENPPCEKGKDGIMYGENMQWYVYDKNMQCSITYDLGGEYLENYVTFDNRSVIGNGDRIYLYDGFSRLIGTYTGSQLAGKKVVVKTKTLKVVADGDEDDSVGWGFRISSISHLPYGVVIPVLNRHH